jgi:hypothetical protein
MNKFDGWTDEELEQLSEAIEVCYSEGIGPDSRDLERALIAELEERVLDRPWWADQLQKGEPIDDED